jgi:hypothetical protein
VKRPPFGRPIDWEDAEEGGVGPYPERHEIEGLAAEFLEQVGLGHMILVPPILVLRVLQVAFGVHVSTEVPRGCLGCTRGNVIAVRDGLSERALMKVIRDEISHWVFRRKGYDVVDHHPMHESFALAWQAPAEHVRRMRNAARGFAWAARAYIRLYQHLALDLSEVLIRCASVCGVGLILHDDTEGRVQMAPGLCELVIDLTKEQEKDLCSRAWDKGNVVTGRGGVQAVAYAYEGRSGVVLCLEPGPVPDEPSERYDADLRAGWHSYHP